MNKYFKHYAVIWLLFFVIFNLVCFVTPVQTENYIKFGGAFWGGYLLITVALICQLAISYAAFKEENLEKFFYKFPLIRISKTGTILIFLFGSVCMLIPDLPNWVGIVICYFILTMNFLALLKADLAAETIKKVGKQVQEKTLFMKELTEKAEILKNNVNDSNCKKTCQKVYETLRYSDPMSSPKLEEIEKRIEDCFYDFSKLTKATNQEKIDAKANELIDLIGERNMKCKLYK